MDSQLFAKYDIPVPRYTSYPTVPFWNQGEPSAESWKKNVKGALKDDGSLSLYIHLPFCETLCTYCACNTRITKNHAVELPYINTLLKEWKLYTDLIGKKPVISELHLGGGTPTFFTADHLRQLLEGIRKEAQFAEDIAMSFEAHPANTTSDHLKILHAQGFRRISIGVQDFNPEIQRMINRRQSISQVRSITDLSRVIGYTSVNYDLIYGLPKQTVASITETIEEVVRLRPDRIAFYSYAHVPWMRPGQRGYSDEDLPQGAAKRELYEKGRELLEAAGYIEIGLDHFAIEGDELLKASQNGTLHRNFMGYTEKQTSLLIGLGVSSISDSGNMFVQNYKVLEEWQAAVDKGEFPLYRAHELNQEDLVLRKHILNIMCKGETSWEEKSAQCDEIKQAEKRLKELINDELVVKKGKSIVVTHKGKPFLRNIGMCFDARLHRARPDGPLFSKSA